MKTIRWQLKLFAALLCVVVGVGMYVVRSDRQMAVQEVPTILVPTDAETNDVAVEDSPRPISSVQSSDVAPETELVLQQCGLSAHSIAPIRVTVKAREPVVQ